MKRKKRPKTATIPNGVSFRFCRVILACLLFPLTISGSLSAQHPQPSDYGLIFGTVWGPDDQPVYGVKIKIRRMGEKKARWEVYSNQLGEFEQRVPVGRQDYLITADLKGFKSGRYKHLQSGSDVIVHVEGDERVDTGVHLK
jgi:hypothetical protein